MIATHQSHSFVRDHSIMKLSLFYVVASWLLLTCCAVPIPSNSPSTKPWTLTTNEILNYLVTYGYLAKKSTNATDGNVGKPSKSPINEQQNYSVYTNREIVFALRDFQAFMGLPRTGLFDEQTSKQMTLQRCGVPDKTPHASWLPLRGPGRQRRFILEGSSFQGTRTLSYHIASPSRQHSLPSVNLTIWKALGKWAEVSQLRFTWCENGSNADIRILFKQGYHGDYQSFDGRGKVVAHGFHPSQGAQVHFDDDELWSLADRGDEPGASNLLRVATHEFGHALGLSHTSSKSSIMHPIFNGVASSTTSLSSDDANGIQSVYGACERPIKSMLSWIRNGLTYAFTKDKFWRFNDTAKVFYPSYPKQIRTFWRNVPLDFDEAFLWGYNWRTYFFKGSVYYRFHDSLEMAEDGYPQSIASGWPGLPDNIDAAFTWSNQVSYFFKGNLCYQFDNGKDRVHIDYPKNITEVWPGIPDNLDSVFRYYWDGKTYFFKGFQYWVWDDAKGVASQPLRIANGWKNICDL